MPSLEWPARLAPLLATPQSVASLRTAVSTGPAPHATLQLLLLQTAARRLAIDILHVAEVAKAPPITFVPRMPRYMLGVANVRGTLMPIVSLAHVLGVVPQAASHDAWRGPQARVVVLRGHAPIGLAVSEALQVARMSPAQLLSPRDDAAAQLPWASAFAPLKEGLTAVLSVDALEHLLRSLQASDPASAAAPGSDRAMRTLPPNL